MEGEGLGENAVGREEAGLAVKDSCKDRQRESQRAGLREGD